MITFTPIHGFNAEKWSYETLIVAWSRVVLAVQGECQCATNRVFGDNVHTKGLRNVSRKFAISLRHIDTKV